MQVLATLLFLEKSEQKLCHDREHPSHVVLPIVPRN
jgi:hypothetical protein